MEGDERQESNRVRRKVKSERWKERGRLRREDVTVGDKRKLSTRAAAWKTDKATVKGCTFHWYQLEAG